MIEVPSAAVLCDLLARECDFLSVGTNDLVQYALAVDRSNEAMSYLYQPSHPSVVRLLRLIVCLASRHRVPVTVCGEMAAEPRFIPLLLGLGVRELSVSSRALPTIKETIRRTTFLEAVHLAEAVLELETGEEIDSLLQAHLDEAIRLTTPW
jgi:phosphoenolpyruvate-protein phosphotransferase (PTS system enzyme I)